MRAASPLNGADLRDYKLDELRRHIALVAQDTYLFNDTLRANILIARPEASEAELQAAIEHASLAELVAALPDGLDTPVGERGTSLSGGQRQRVAIARAFLKDAPILVLDEATSHLDAVNEQAVRARARPPAGRPHHHRHRPSPVDRARRRPDRGAGRGPGRRDRHARLAAGAAAASTRGWCRASSLRSMLLPHR